MDYPIFQLRGVREESRVVASRWILLSSFGASCLLAAPAHAGGKLVSWSFDPAQNRLSFQTARGVQPRAQLVPNPSRIVMDLPGTEIGNALKSKNFNGAIRQVRIGQYDARTTRLVVELAPGYEVDPQQVLVRGASPTQWSVQLPSPNVASRSSAPAPASRPITSSPAPVIAERTSSRVASPTGTPSGNPLQVTRSGILLRPPGGIPENITVTRSADRAEIEVALPGTEWPSRWTRSPQVIGQYGLGTVEFLPPVESKKKKRRRPARLRLVVNPESPDWRAISTRTGELILVTRGGFSPEVARLSSPGAGAVAARPPQSATPPRSAAPRPTTPPVERRSSRPAPTRDRGASSRVAESTATIEGVLVLDDNRLVVRGDRNLQTTNPIWDPSSRSYWVLVRDAVLSPSLRGPQLSGRGAIRQVRILQRDARTVAISVTVGDGVRADNFNRLDDGRIVAFNLASPPQSGPLDLIVPPVTAQQPPPRPQVPTPRVPRSAPLVTIDPGHGGKDPGAIGIGGIREKDIVLDISRQVQGILSANGMRVLMTRSDDRFISLQGRVDVSNRANADIFVSIHANAISLSRPDINGVETFYARGSTRGQALASSIQSSILQNIDIGSRGVKRSGFFVLKHTDMPAALVEVGFVTGREDAPKLRDPSFRRQMAQAIADGILNYVRQSSGAR